MNKEEGGFMRERKPGHWHDILPNVSIAVSAVAVVLALVALAARM